LHGAPAPPPAPDTSRRAAARGAVALAIIGIVRISFPRTRVARLAAFVRGAPLRCIDLVPIIRVFLIALALAPQDLVLVGGVGSAVRCENLFAELPVVRVALAATTAALGRGERTRALAATLLATAPLAPAIFARALAVAGHGWKFPDAETRAAAKRGRSCDHAATQVGCGRLARSTCRSRVNPRSGAAFQA